MGKGRKGKKNKPRYKNKYANQTASAKSAGPAVKSSAGVTENGNSGSVPKDDQGVGVAVASYQQQEQRQSCDMAGTVTLSFDATDTLFFRESRPMESMGELQSVFPPPVRTLAGAVRTLIGESAAVSWPEYEKDKNHPLRAVIGYRDELGALSLKGPWLATGKGQRLYPAPLHLLKKEDSLCSLELETEGTWCDLGRHVRLPRLPVQTGQNRAGSKPLENTWLTQAAMETVLAGGLPDSEQLKTEKALFVRESRLGIARDNQTRMVRDGLLYQTQHIRPKDDLRVEVDVDGLPEFMPSTAMLRLGGEGRTAHISATASVDHFPVLPDFSGSDGLMLYLLTPMHRVKPSGDAWEPLPGFVRDNDAIPTIWRGTLRDVDLILYAAVTGKALRQGGWDMAKHRPRAVTSLIPAGSVFFCKAVNADIQAAAEHLHNQHIGMLTEYGYGHLAVGIWNDSKEKS